MSKLTAIEVEHVVWCSRCLFWERQTDTRKGRPTKAKFVERIERRGWRWCSAPGERDGGYWTCPTCKAGNKEKRK